MVINGTSAHSETLSLFQNATLPFRLFDVNGCAYDRFPPSPVPGATPLQTHVIQTNFEFCGQKVKKKREYTFVLILLFLVIPHWFLFCCNKWLKELLSEVFVLLPRVSVGNYITSNILVGGVCTMRQSLGVYNGPPSHCVLLLTHCVPYKNQPISAQSDYVAHLLQICICTYLHNIEHII